MDDGSCNLIQAWIDELDIKYVMLILICREEEFDGVSSLFEKKCNHLLTIPVKNLAVGDVHQLVARILKLKLSSSRNRELCDLVYQRTLGNPFYVTEFVDFLLQQGMIVNKGSDTTKWSFNIESIRRETMIADNLVNILMTKISRVHSSVQEALSVASLIGFRFDSSVLINCLDMLYQLRVDCCHEESVVALREAELFGFIEPLQNGYFQFKHDKVQSAFQSNLSDDESQLIHSCIGRVYLAHGDDEACCRAAGHMIASYELLTNDEERVYLSQICLNASIYCQERSDFFSAGSLLRFALEVIPYDEKWNAHYDLALKLSVTLAKIEMVLGNFQACRRINAEVLFQANSVNDQLETLETCIEEAVADTRVMDCEIALNEALAAMEIWIPRKVSMLHVMYKLIRVKSLLGRKTNEFLLTMPEMTEKRRIIAVKLLRFGAVFGLRNGNESHSIYCALVAIELSMKFGLSIYTCDAFAIYSLALLILGSLSDAYKYANLARILGERPQLRDSGSIATLLVNNMVSHWKESLHDLIEPTSKAVFSCMESGDLSFGIFGAAILMGIRTSAGHHLEALKVDFYAFYSKYKCYKQEGSWRILEPNIQYIENLTSRSTETLEELTELSGEIMNEAEYIEHAIQSKNEILLPILYVLKLQLTFYLQQYRVGHAVLKKMRAFKKILSYGFNYSSWQLFGALINYACFRKSLRWKYVRQARKYKRSFLGKWMFHCPNAIPMAKILDAEDASISSSVEITLEAYNTAVQAISHAKHINLEALISERAGKFLLQKDVCRNDAMIFLERSLSLYQDGWGALAKADELREYIASVQSQIAGEATTPDTVIEFVETSGQENKLHDEIQFSNTK
jgi:histidine kinase